MIGLRPVRALTRPVFGQAVSLALGAIAAYAVSGVLHEYGQKYSIA